LKEIFWELSVLNQYLKNGEFPIIRLICAIPYLHKYVNMELHFGVTNGIESYDI